MVFFIPVCKIYVYKLEGLLVKVTITIIIIFTSTLIALNIRLLWIGCVVTALKDWCLYISFQLGCTGWTPFLSSNILQTAVEASSHSKHISE